jgi:predicted nucleic acid-binding protein
MVTLIDTSAIYAYLDRDDANHERAKATFFELLDRGAPLLTHNYIAVESSALVQRRLGTIANRALHDDVLRVIDVIWIDEATHRLAVHAMLSADKRDVSLVDWTSFTVMRERRVGEAFAFDEDFRDQGYLVIPS